jgi:hypothetical protein
MEAKPHPCWIEEEKVFDHDWVFKQDVIGDYGVVNGTQTICWMECENCGEEKEADYSDYPSSDDDFI